MLLYFKYAILFRQFPFQIHYFTEENIIDYRKINIYIVYYKISIRLFIIYGLTRSLSNVFHTLFNSPRPNLTMMTDATVSHAIRILFLFSSVTVARDINNLHHTYYIIYLSFSISLFFIIILSRRYSILFI